ncbi:polymorphic toxin type 15 domain-containing protein [Bacillus sp. MHSD_36]|uniref:polymorphic toxin type 15 domain-containing protein n=1 Tax=unclassified Bacillus (in: firmicutes) TaxID=185979 RepID=UPI00274267BE|nr:MULTISPECIES: polymorphic toxin type 15 domain-containing protein [unclassified Bacillus (in: firmicutes)]MDP7988675.1 polymorphic toxin type 15 domain-containing protein [Bacillus sp. MHSD_36]MDR4978049.1 polymorphic toxin type 15 domain-containing protein [Bacillus sp. MHSD_37]
MDVKYRPEPWQNMGDGMNRITKDALIKLRHANELLKKIDGRIRDLDSDGSIHFNPKDQSQKIGELLDSYSTLQKYCGEAGRLVSEHIDKPFLVEMDKFAQKMRDTSILSFETDNRIGSTTTTVLPDAHAGYGSVPQTIQTKKDKITVEDIFRDSPAFDNVLRAEYKELKKQNPDAKLNYEEYKKVVPSTRGFEYKSIEDEQKKLEMVRDIGIGLGIIITTILCPPLGAAAAVVYGAVQIKSGIDGEDWGTHRKLSQEERVGNIIFGGLDAIPVVGAVGKGVKAFKGTSELADLAKLLKFKEGMPGFNPNLGKNVVQSLKENKTLKNALDAMKNTPIPVAVRMVDTGIGVRLPYIESSTVGEVAGKFSKASTAAKDDAYQLAHGHSKLEGSNKTSGVGNNSSRTDEIGIEFKRNPKHNEDEFIRQLKNQEDGLGKLTVDEFIQNRNQFLKYGRSKQANSAQRLARKQAVQDKIDEFMEEGFSFREAEEQALKWIKDKAALHDPDQIAGGNPLKITGMGDSRINSSIGSQWKSRIGNVDKEIRRVADTLSEEEKKLTYLNVRLKSE